MILITDATGTNGIEIVKLLSRMGVAWRALVRSSEESAPMGEFFRRGSCIRRFRRPRHPDASLGGHRQGASDLLHRSQASLNIKEIYSPCQSRGSPPTCCVEARLAYLGT